MCSNNQTNLRYVSRGEGKTVEFKSVKDKLSAIDGDSIFAYYPWNSKSHGDSIKLPNNMTQSHKENGNKYNVFLATGKVNENKLSLQFKHLYAYLKIISDALTSHQIYLSC